MEQTLGFVLVELILMFESKYYEENKWAISP